MEALVRDETSGFRGARIILGSSDLNIETILHEALHAHLWLEGYVEADNPKVVRHTFTNEAGEEEFVVRYESLCSQLFKIIEEYLGRSLPTKG